MRLSLILAMADNGVIGLSRPDPSRPGASSSLPWHLPRDLRRFKRLTVGHTMIMGRKTWDSIGRPLPKRRSLVLTRDLGFRAEGAEVAHSLDQALAAAAAEEEAFIIGGVAVFAEALPRADRVYLTRVHGDVEGDVRLPELDLDGWRLVASEPHLADERHALAFTFECWNRRRSTRCPERH